MPCKTATVRSRALVLGLASCILAPASTCARAQDAKAPVLAPVLAGAVQPAVSGAEIRQDLRRFAEMGRVLYVAAHPDDENTQLITYLARGRNYRTAYLSLTRGDGGQNVLGGEFGSSLGVIRTQELLAARRIDGAQQFFTRAPDFGFSKSADETLRIWDRQQVLGDVVRVIRAFRPDVIITRFSPTAGGTHGHHTASAMLALEAFTLVRDAPEKVQFVKDWKPTRILQNGRGEVGLQMDIGGADTVTGESFASIAGRSRAMHKSQGFDGFTVGATRPESFQLLGGAPATKDIFEGIDTTWNRYADGAEVAKMTSQVLADFKVDDPAASVSALVKLRAGLDRLRPQPPASSNRVVDSVLDEKKRDLDRIIQVCAGLSVSTTIAQAQVVRGEKLDLRHTVTSRSKVPVQWGSLYYPSQGRGKQTFNGVMLGSGQSEVRQASPTLPRDEPLSHPEWLSHSFLGAGRQEDARPFPVSYLFGIGGRVVLVSDDPVQVLADGKTRRLEVIAPVSLKIATPVRLFAPASTRAVEVQVLAARANSSGTLSLDAPGGWKIQPAAQPFKLAAAGSRATLTFQVTAPNSAASASITARASVNGTQVSTQRVEINYPHIPPILLQPPAQAKAVALDLKIRGRNVGYIPGAGDSVADSLEQMGYRVAMLTGDDLTPEKLRTLDAIVIGVRAFNVRDDLAAKMPALLAFVEGGGNVIAQYNRPDRLKVPAEKIAPFSLTLSGSRVTDENAAVTFLAPDHPALSTPNKISAADFDGWVQERGVYFPSTWAPEWTPILAASDPGEEPLRGGLLVAKYGRGNFVYTGLALFRQLPAGVPGAYRLMANLVSLGK